MPFFFATGRTCGIVLVVALGSAPRWAPEPIIARLPLPPPPPPPAAPLLSDVAPLAPCRK
jgi:hypothetical protein